MEVLCSNLTFIISTLVASARDESTGPNTKTGLIVTNWKPCFLDRSQAAFSANVCSSLWQRKLSGQYVHAGGYEP